MIFLLPAWQACLRFMGTALVLSILRLIIDVMVPKVSSRCSD